MWLLQVSDPGLTGSISLQDSQDYRHPPYHLRVQELFALLFCFSRQGFSVVLEPVLELTLVDQAGLGLTKTIHLPLPPEFWD
ncbi:hypothetical protein ACRRTK_000254 [Alexandromys fortis]